MRRPSIPSRVPGPGENREAFDSALMQNLQIITGQRGGKIAPLEKGASLEQVVAKVNEIIDRMQ